LTLATACTAVVNA